MAKRGTYVRDSWGANTLIRGEAEAFSNADKFVSGCLEFRDSVRQNLMTTAKG